MALDGAEFISELSILDPPGTDPLNQGDDHIRTVKRATQQSFPNVGSAVPQTGVQMAQMAIKNEENLFTLRNTFQSTLTDFDSLGGDTHLRHLSNGARNWQVGVQGATKQWEYQRYIAGVFQDRPLIISNDFGEATFANDATFDRTILLADGVPTAPAYRFKDQTNMGWYRENPDTLAVSVAGVRQARIFPTLFQMFQPLTLPDGVDANDPGLQFGSGGGILGNTNGLTAVFNGVTTWAMSTNGNFSGVGFKNHVDGALGAAVPGWTFSNDSDTGIGRAGANSLNIIAGGEVVANFDFGSAMWMGAGYRIRGMTENTPTSPAFSFTNDTDTGVYRVQANILGFAAAGQIVGSWGVGGFGVSAGVPVFLSLPSSPGIGGSLWVDLTDAKRVKVV